jgi:hypothetical protein
MKGEIPDRVFAFVTAGPDLVLGQLRETGFDSLFELLQLAGGELQEQSFHRHVLPDAVNDAIIDKAITERLRTNPPSFREWKLRVPLAEFLDRAIRHRADHQ